MDVVKVVIFSIVGAFLSLVLKEYKPFIATALSVVTATAVFVFVLPELKNVIDYAKAVYCAAGEYDMYIEKVLKITGIACLAWFGSDILKDAGQLAAASAVVMVGKILCMSLCLPMIGALFEMLVSILPS